MTIVPIWTGNAGRNINYLVGCEATGEALAVDPLDHRKCLAEAARRGWTIRQVVNTHEHGDHTGGNAAIVAATGARVLAHADAAIAGVDQGLREGDEVRVGTTVSLRVLDTPGHTYTHVCLYADGAAPALFAGDTVFNAGVGNCHNGGDPEILYETFARVIGPLPDATTLYPGHDYLARNLSFTLSLEPSNQAARDLLAAITSEPWAAGFATTLGIERGVNTFFRLAQPEVVASVSAALPDLRADASERAVFLGLRLLRNRW